MNQKIPGALQSQTEKHARISEQHEPVADALAKRIEPHLRLIDEQIGEIQKFIDENKSAFTGLSEYELNELSNEFNTWLAHGSAADEMLVSFSQTLAGAARSAKMNTDTINELDSRATEHIHPIINANAKNSVLILPQFSERMRALHRQMQMLLRATSTLSEAFGKDNKLVPLGLHRYLSEQSEQSLNMIFLAVRTVRNTLISLPLPEHRESRRTEEETLLPKAPETVVGLADTAAFALQNMIDRLRNISETANSGANLPPEVFEILQGLFHENKLAKFHDEIARAQILARGEPKILLRKSDKTASTQTAV